MNSNLTQAQAVDPSKRELFGHPVGLFYLFFAELWERFSFYGMRALLTLYMVNKIFEALGDKDIVAAIIYSSYGSLVYASPVIGGRIADTLLGSRKSIVLGGILMSIGHFVLAIENNIFFFLALSFIIVGNGFFKPNISTFVGSLYEKGDPRKDSGFTIFYMGINIGAFVSPLLCGLLAAKFGWHYGFGLAGVGMLTGLVVFVNGSKKGVFGSKGLPPKPELLKERRMGIPVGSWVTILSFLAVPLIAFILSSYKFIAGGDSFLGEITWINLLFYVISVVILIYLIVILVRVTTEERKKLVVAIFLTIFMTLFWGFHELSGSVLTLFADRNVSLFLIDAAQTNAINPLFIIILSIPMSGLWVYLMRRKMNPRTPYKFSIGLATLGIGFYLLYLSQSFASNAGLVPFIFLIVMYLFISVGELFMSPVGLSKITDLSPKAYVAFMMGIWFLSSAYAFQIVGFIAKQLAIEGSSAGGIDPTESLPIYTAGFELISYYAFGAALVALALAPLLKRWMQEVH